jgi:hypothetical protein
MSYITGNQNNGGICATKINRSHNKNDIEYLGDWISHIKVIKFKGKDKYLESLNKDLQEINNGIEDNIEKELEEKYKNEINNLKPGHHDFQLLDKCFTTMKTKM